MSKTNKEIKLFRNFNFIRKHNKPSKFACLSFEMLNIFLLLLLGL